MIRCRTRWILGSVLTLAVIAAAAWGWFSTAFMLSEHAPIGVTQPSSDEPAIVGAEPGRERTGAPARRSGVDAAWGGVQDADIRGQVLSPGGRALEGVLVACDVVRDGSRLSRLTTTSGARGDFSFSLPRPEEEVRAAVVGALHGERLLDSQLIQREEFANPVTLWTRTRLLLLEGRVLGESSAPVPGAWIASDDEAVSCGSDGRFRLEVIASAWAGVAVRAGAPGYVTHSARYVCTAERAELEIVLTNGRIVSGSVLADGWPIEAATVTCRAIGETVSCDRSGEFRIQVPSTDVSLAASADGYSPVGKRVGRNVAHIEFHLRKPSRLRVLALGPGGIPVAGARIYCASRIAGYLEPDGVTDSEGVAILEVSPSGLFREIYAEARGGLKSELVAVDFTKSTSIRLDLVQSEVFRGRVVFAHSGFPAVGAIVVPAPNGRARDMLSVRTNLVGEFEVLFADNREPLADVILAGCVRQRVHLTRGERTTIRMESEGVLRIRILDAVGRPVERQAEILLRRSSQDQDVMLPVRPSVCLPTGDGVIELAGLGLKIGTTVSVDVNVVGVGRGSHDLASLVAPESAAILNIAVE